MDRYTVDLDSCTDDLRPTTDYFLWSDPDTIQVNITYYSLGTYKLDDFVLAIF